MNRLITFTSKGVQINGTFVPYEADLHDIAKTEIDTLKGNPLDSWEGFLIMRELVEIRKDLQVHQICPVNTEGIKKLIREQIAKEPARVWTKTKKILAGIGIILGIIIGILNIVHLLHNILKP